ncbi:HAD family hydrolase [Aureivirga sp. CE67]|uniref:HAD family hydrolase n=1 Tax=Aureivirga sp. CE67 TaxID=1788983 RepID=UPI0018C8EE7B|nr:HAD family hydrolase [Aureivirga sp. CE67]
MIVSFDLDNTLIPYSNEFEVENEKLLGKIIGAEKIRKGTIKLFHKIEKKNCEIWIYTTSFRSKLKIKKTFAIYGLRPTKIINGELNNKTLELKKCKASKNPNLFGINLHIDDLKGVAEEGEKYKFETLIIEPEELNWTEKILNRIEDLRL